MSSAEDRRLATALCVSLVVHVVVMSQVSAIKRERRFDSGGALTVTLPSPLRPADGRDKPPAELAPPVAALRDSTVRLEPRIEKAPVAKSTQRPPVAPTFAGSNLPTSRQQTAAAPPHSGRSSAATPPRASDPGAGVVDVLLVIGHDGHPRGIHWDRLPALTNDQLRELEAMIRRQTYPSMEGARLTQTIDVFGLLAISRRAPGIVDEPAP